MCLMEFSPFSFTRVSSRKDGYGRTEKLCLLTRMRGPSSGGCGRPVDWSTASLRVGFMRPSGVGGEGCDAISGLWWALWGMCVIDESFPSLC